MTRVGPGEVRHGAEAGQGRPQAIEYSDWYYRRQTLHRYASFLMLPFFVAQYLAGEELLRDGEDEGSWARDVHEPLASGIQALFVINTITGIWNLWDTRAESSGRGQRILHAAAMLAADVGFLTIGEVEDDDEGEREGGGEGNGLQSHRRHAVLSMSVATVGYLIMLLPSLRD